MNLHRESNENEEQFIWRIGQAKESGAIDLSWDEIAEIINKEFRDDESEYRTAAAYRKPYQQAKRFYESNVFSSYLSDNESYIDELRNAKFEIKKERQKLSDERTALNKSIREQSRIENMYDIMKSAINNHYHTVFEYTPTVIEDSDNDLIIHLTDIHAGVAIHNAFNDFDFSVLEQRLKNFLDEIYDIQKTYHSQNAYLILGGDLIQGLIHVNSRIEAKENIVQQIMMVADLIGAFINELSPIFQNVYVHSTAGNHSRVTENKEYTAHGENYDLLIPWAAKKALKDVLNVQFVDNYLDYDIATFKVRGHMVYATHGDKDSSKTVVYNMTKFARRAGLPLPDMCYLGHRHTNGLTTVDEVKVIESGCVDGMDSFSIDKRLTGRAEQTVTVVTAKRRIKALCDIQID